MCSCVCVYVMGKISKRGGRSNWFQHSLNRSRLDRYYWVLAGLSLLNMVVFLFVASCCRYKNREEGYGRQGSA
ncbi:protein NRT1/ PTR FAMILY 5.5-like [Salvia divinorum]|uniref:Protein NRT1/ PTR FAMILY 5.5-like n=1 Tax=Salvia divinorum TaxID=28513 RepID=A0ABD1HZS6_SALDI